MRDVPAGGAELDELTLARARRGEEPALQALVVLYQRPVFALVSRLAPAHAAAWDDLAQETFLRVFRALPGFDPRGPARLSSWILTVATRLTIDHLRRAPQRHASGDPVFPGVGGNPQAAARDPLLRSALRRAIEALQPDFRAVFLLREVHELSYEEIALALELELGTVRSRLSRARSALRDALEDHHQ